MGDRVQKPMVRIEQELVDEIDAYAKRMSAELRMSMTRTAAVERLLRLGLERERERTAASS